MARLNWVGLCSVLALAACGGGAPSGDDGAAADSSAARSKGDCQEWNTEAFFTSATPGEVRGCLDAGADANAADDGGKTPLHWASERNENVEVVRVLLDAGADVGAATGLGSTPLHGAASSNGNVEVVRALLDAGADIGAANYSVRRSGGISVTLNIATPLHYAAQINENAEVTRALLEAGADAGGTDKYGQTPLHYAAESNENVEVTRALLEAGADAGATDNAGLTPLQYATESNRNAEVARALMYAGADPGEAVDAETGTITLSLAGDPSQLDSTRSTDAVSLHILGHTMEGLLRYDADNRLVGGVAQRWEISDTTATFWLKPEARWSNGEPVTAHDFVFAWRKVLDPRNASMYAFILHGLKNAEAVSRAELPLASLGVHALDEKTLEVHLERPVPYFDKLAAFATYNPINEAFYEARQGHYAADAEDLLYNGPFKIARWVHGVGIRLEKNPHYWNADRIRLNAIDYAYFTTDPNAIINLFKDNKTALAALVAEILDEAVHEGWKINRFSDGAVYFMEFNHRVDRLTRNYHLRKAIQAVNDSPELVHRIINLPGKLPGASLFPVWLKGVDGYFREEYPLPDPPPDDELGRRHLGTAMKELGLSEPPTLVMLSGDNPTAKKQAEYYRMLYKQKLGLDIQIDAQTFRQRLAKVAAGDFDILMAGWGPDYDDPMTFADLFASWNEANRGRFASAELDDAVDVARSSSDPKTRMDAMARVQRILFDEAAIVVTYESGSAYVSHPRLKGIVRRAVGTDPDYTGAWIE